MKIAGITLERPPRAGLVHLAGCWAAGFLAAACSLEGRAPLAAGLMAARERCGVTISLDADLQDDMEGAAWRGAWCSSPSAGLCAAAASWC